MSPKAAVAAGQIQADFNKEVGGKAFGNRVQLRFRVDDAADRCTASVETRPHRHGHTEQA